MLTVNRTLTENGVLNVNVQILTMLFSILNCMKPFVQTVRFQIFGEMVQNNFHTNRKKRNVYNALSLRRL